MTTIKDSFGNNLLYVSNRYVVTALAEEVLSDRPLLVLRTVHVDLPSV
jgi:hypothetical protein